MPRSAAVASASQVDLALLSTPPLPVELWLAIFDGFSYSELHRARAINRGFSQWVLSGQYDRVLFREDGVEPGDVPRKLKEGGRARKQRKLAYHPLLRHLVLGDAPWSSWLVRRPGAGPGRPRALVPVADLAALQENATWPPVRALSSLAVDLPESRSFALAALPATKDGVTGRAITVERVLRTLEKILTERVYLPGNIDRNALPWVRPYERTTGRISWRGEYTSPLVIAQAFEPWDGRLHATVDWRTGDVSLLATGFRRASFRAARARLPPWRRRLTGSPIQCFETQTTTTGGGSSVASVNTLLLREASCARPPGGPRVCGAIANGSRVLQWIGRRAALEDRSSACRSA